MERPTFVVLLLARLETTARGWWRETTCGRAHECANNFNTGLGTRKWRLRDGFSGPTQRSQGRSQRAVPVRQREKVQKLLRSRRVVRMDSPWRVPAISSQLPAIGSGLSHGEMPVFQHSVIRDGCIIYRRLNRSNSSSHSACKVCTTFCVRAMH